MNSTYWAPFAAHNTRTVQVKRSTPILCNLIRLILNLFHQIAQELLMGLMTSHSQKVDLNMAPGTKHCELISSCFYEIVPTQFLFNSSWQTWGGTRWQRSFSRGGTTAFPHTPRCIASLPSGPSYCIDLQQVSSKPGCIALPAIWLVYKKTTTTMH